MSTQLNIAIVEDHDALREVMLDHIQQFGHHVFGADCAEALDDLMIKNMFDLIILDLNLPGEDGLSIAQRMRAAYPEIFIIMMTARDGENDRISGYQLGADLYLPKTTSLKELEAAVETVVRRKTSQMRHEEKNAIKLDLKKLVLVGNEEIKLGRAESLILKSLVQAVNHKLEYWRLLELVGKEVNDRNQATLHVTMLRIRKKMAAAGATGDLIKSLSGEGYQLIYPVTMG